MSEGKLMSDEYWKKPEPTENQEIEVAPNVGLWSRSFAFRVFIWVDMTIIVIVLALFATAYLSGFDSVFEMFDWYRASF